MLKRIFSKNKNIKLGRWEHRIDHTQSELKAIWTNSDHCGDIICSLPVIQELSKTHQCNLFINLNKKMPVPYYKHPAGNVFIDNRIYALIEPLLKNQRYIKSVSIFKGEEIDIDLDLFREMPINLNFNSCRWFFHIAGIQVDLTEPYLKVEEHNKLKNKTYLRCCQLFVRTRR